MLWLKVIFSKKYIHLQLAVPLPEDDESEDERMEVSRKFIPMICLSFNLSKSIHDKVKCTVLPLCVSV